MSEDISNKNIKDTKNIKDVKNTRDTKDVKDIKDVSIKLVGQGTLEKGKIIAEGTYGILYSAKRDGMDYAVKKSKVEKQINFIATLKEVDFLSRLNSHPLILNLIAISKGSPFGYNQTATDKLDKVG